MKTNPNSVQDSSGCRIK